MPTRENKSKIVRVSVRALNGNGVEELRVGRFIRQIPIQTAQGEIYGFLIHLFPTLSDVEPEPREFPPGSICCLPL